MVRTLVDLPEQSLKRLTEMAKEAGLSRTRLMRQILERYLAEEYRMETSAFGIWQNRQKQDALVYEDDLRGPRIWPPFRVPNPPSSVEPDLPEAPRLRNRRS